MKKNYYLLGLILLLGFLLRVHQLGKESIWLDEGVSIDISLQEPTQIIKMIWLGTDVHPPLYYVLLHFWRELVGISEFSIRFLSLIFGVAGIFFIYKMGTLLCDPKVGFYSALLMALSTFHLEYSQEARNYSLLVILSLLSCYYYFKLLFFEDTKRSKLLYILFTASLLYTHAYALFVLLVQCFHSLIIFFQKNQLTSLRARDWLLIQFMLFILIVPWVPVFFNQLSQFSDDNFLFIPRLGILYSTILAFSGSTLLMLLFFGFILMALFKKSSHRKESPNVMMFSEVNPTFSTNSMSFLLIWLVFPIVTLFLLSHLITPVYQIRGTLTASIPFYIIVSKGMSKLKGRYLTWVLVTGVVSMGFQPIERYYSMVNKEEWRGLVTHLEEEVQVEDLIVLHAGYCLSTFEYYFKNKEIPVLTFPKEGKRIDQNSILQMDIQLSKYKSIWLVVSHEHDSVVHLLRHLQSTYQILDEKHLVGIDLYHFKS